MALADGGRTASTTTIELGEGIHAFWDAIWNVVGPYDKHNPTIVDWVKRVHEQIKELDPEETRWSTGWYQVILKQKPFEGSRPGRYSGFLAEGFPRPNGESRRNPGKTTRGRAGAPPLACQREDGVDP